MTRRKRRNHSPEFKAKVAIAVLKGDNTLAGLAQQLDVHPNQIPDWKMQLQARPAAVFGEKPARKSGPKPHNHSCYNGVLYRARLQVNLWANLRQ